MSGSISAWVPTSSASSPLEELAEDVPAPACRGGAGQQRSGQGLGAHQPLDGCEVLFCKGLCRGHQGRLVAMLDGAQHRVERDDGLAAADLAHQQPLHRLRLGEIHVDLVDSVALVAGGREGQRVLEPARAERRRILKRAGPGAGSARGASAQERQLGEQELLEGQPLSPRLGVVGKAGKVHCGERGRPVGQTLDDSCGRRERLGDVCERSPGALDEGEQLGRADALGGRVVGHRVALAGSVGHLAGGLGGERVMGDAKASAPVGLAVQQQPRAGGVALDQPGLVEERRAHRGGGVEDDRLDERPHAPSPHCPRADPADLYGDGRLLAGPQRGDGPPLAAVAGQMLEQIAHRVKPER